ncbi:MAG: hypothetical protein ACFCUM_09295 [Bacteroidales bacterium]
MTATILIITGIIITGIGTISLIKSLNVTPEKNQPLEGDLYNDSISKEHELMELIQLAVADGVVTNNEEKIILKKAAEIGCCPDYTKNLLEAELMKKADNAETRVIDKMKEKGDAFEAFIASKFDTNLFLLKEWTGDKYIKGIWAQSTKNPDLRFSFKMSNVIQDFAIECKYRTKIGEGIEWARKDQIEHYRNYETENRIPVFVAVGVGNQPDNPSQLSLIPLKDINDTIISQELLSRYRKRNLHSKIFFDHQQLSLG